MSDQAESHFNRALRTRSRRTPLMSVSKSVILLPAADGIYLQSLVDLCLLRRTTEAHLLLDTPVISGRAFGTRDRPNILSMLFISCVSLTLKLSFEFCVCLCGKKNNPATIQI